MASASGAGGVFVCAEGNAPHRQAPPASRAVPRLGGRTEACTGHGPFRHRVVLVHAVPADAHCPKEPTSTPVDRLASGEDDLLPMAKQSVRFLVVAEGS